MEFSKVIAEMLKETSPKGTPEGMDMFLPCALLILVKLPLDSVLVTQLKSNISYLRLFRHDSRMQGENECYLVTIEGAVGFLHDMSAKDLTL
jgi:hypothetical protein